MEEKNQLEQQEILFKLSVFEQNINQLKQQLEAIEKGIVKLSSLSLELDDFKGKEGKEIFAPVGQGIFAKTKLFSEDLIIDIGGGNFVKKSILETQKILKEQIVRLEDVKKELNKNLEEVNREIEKVIEKASRENKKK